ncbi:MULTISPECIES: aminoglycoside phosphotransferase family protein [unclassified Nodularia (in: cyanobacteria)]|uniref:phosphotransferase enzyme family protein n=1 Tax=unclassified Nodularia (in: cyanobacteria) TaxID=2656917 RepID=UPI001881B2C9|nr:MULTISPECIES: aminoglycoside phosphotransferase family protein [unclassified Nodularia (in: cyanobacteria)]MBE9197796.1 aminoglycoside phosphotransferase family protein [Nodularia sp. LEGE 06071]MCC2695057.1 aminoglycoside phosphotransferase family protein [Nodularia sp. LEGE 04288]
MTTEITLIAIAEQFTSQGQVTGIQSLGNGNINDTFLVTLDSSERKHFVLQRINTQVFRQPELVMQNMQILTDHVCVRQSRAKGNRQSRAGGDRLKLTSANRRWEVPRVLLTQDTQNLWIDENNGYWRAISFVENAQSFDTLPDISYASEIGYALGMFHNLISDLPPAKLADTLPGFHITPVYLQQYEDILKKAAPHTSPEVNYCLQFVTAHTSFANILEDAKATGKLPLRLMHGDPKINNVMFDIATHKAISIIDLDTVKPGLVHYDIGDCLRSGCNPMGEETEEWEKVYFDTDLCQGILQGYLDVAQAFLTENDYSYIYAAIRLITFELGLRFLTDYLAGDVYFKVKYPEHNLARALVQFKLTESIESQETKIRQIIQDLK